MYEIRIDKDNGCDFLYGRCDEWKNYVCENFDEHVVLLGNRYYPGVKEAEWYVDVMLILNDIDCYDEYPEDLSDEQNAKLKELYDNCRRTDDIVVDALRVIFPNETFKTGTIRGYNQSDWQDYIIKGNVDEDTLENFYFGKLSEIAVTDTENDTSFFDVITDDELWKHDDDLKDYLRKRYELEEEDVRVLVSDGYTQVLKWKEIA